MVHIDRIVMLRSMAINPEWLNAPRESKSLRRDKMYMLWIIDNSVDNPDYLKKKMYFS